MCCRTALSLLAAGRASFRVRLGESSQDGLLDLIDLLAPYQDPSEGRFGFERQGAGQVSIGPSRPDSPKRPQALEEGVETEATREAWGRV